MGARYSGQPVPEAPSKQPSNLLMRFLTALVGVPILLSAMYLAPKGAFLLIVLAAGAIAANELFLMVTPQSKVQRAYGVLVSLGVMAFLFVAVDSYAKEGYDQFTKLLFPLAIPGLFLLLILGLLVSLVAPEPIERASERAGWLIAGPLYIGGLVGSVGLLHLRAHGPSWVVLAMCLAWLGDTGGYFAGRYFGKHKLYEKVSPKKTVEGAFGALGGALVGVLAAHFWFLPELPLGHGVVLAIVGGSLGMCGDLCESLIKRGTGVKDSGALLPGHGGLLDRIDALMFTAATTWIYATWVLDGHL